MTASKNERGLPYATLPTRAPGPAFWPADMRAAFETGKHDGAARPCDLADLFVSIRDEIPGEDGGDASQFELLHHLHNIDRLLCVSARVHLLVRPHTMKNLRILHSKWFSRAIDSRESWLKFLKSKWAGL